MDADVPYCIGRCKVCPYYESCQKTSRYLEEEY